MKTIAKLCALFGTVLILISCSTYTPPDDDTLFAPQLAADFNPDAQFSQVDYSTRLPETISSKQKTVYVDPNVHAWGAYSNGHLVYSGLATAGGHWCSDVGRSCRTVSGTFRIYSLGSSECRSKTYPIGKGGALMPYCMFFSGGYSLHGSTEMIEGNASHGCVRLRIPDAEWLRYNFASVGTQVIIKPY